MIDFKVNGESPCSDRTERETVLKAHFDSCIDNYKAGNSKLDKKSAEMDGMIGQGARNILNLLAGLDNCSYLQVGTWKGACLYSALYGNDVDYAFACDNFMQYSIGQGGTFKAADGSIKTNLNLNLDVMLNFMQPDENDTDNVLEFSFHNGDCFDMPLSRIKKPIDVYFYDGGHNLADHFLALYYYYDALDHDFIFVCDDWAEEKVQRGTNAAIEHCNLRVVNECVHENMFIAQMQKFNLNTGRRVSAITASEKEANEKGYRPAQNCRLTSKEIQKGFAV